MKLPTTEYPIHIQHIMSWKKNTRWMNIDNKPLPIIRASTIELNFKFVTLKTNNEFTDNYPISIWIFDWYFWSSLIRYSCDVCVCVFGLEPNFIWMTNNIISSFHTYTLVKIQFIHLYEHFSINLCSLSSWDLYQFNSINSSSF